MEDGKWKRESHPLILVGDDVRSLNFSGIQLEIRHLRQKNHVGIEPGVAVARQSAAKRTGVFQMAAFS
jgi:hypothetical protein